MYPIGVHSRQLRLALTVAVLALVAGGCTNTRVHTGSLAASGNDPCASQQHPGAEIDCAALLATFHEAIDAFFYQTSKEANNG